MAADDVTLRAKSYASLLRRLAIARHEAQWCREEMERTQRWAQQDLGTEIRLLRDRVTFLYVAAVAAGASREDLAG